MTATSDLPNMTAASFCSLQLHFPLPFQRGLAVFAQAMYSLHKQVRAGWPACDCPPAACRRRPPEETFFQIMSWLRTKPRWHGILAKHFSQRFQLMVGLLPQVRQPASTCVDI